MINFLTLTHPLPGSLVARLFKNEKIGLELAAYFDIEVPLTPFSWDGEKIETSMCLDFIPLPKAPSWKQIESKTFYFPRSPNAGYIDASIYFQAAHHRFDVDEIAFGMKEAGRIVCHISGQFNFVSEGIPELGQPHFAFDVCLKFDELKIQSVFQMLY